ncbi:MAG: histidine kinase [Pseudomonadota bacterium]|nr:histidine kinase [Pseudomonadota bacterium]
MDAINSSLARTSPGWAGTVPDNSVAPFADWRIAVRSILGFWLFYAATVVARALLSGDVSGVLQNRAVTIGGGILLTFGVYAAINFFAAGASTRRRAAVAALASLLAASAEAGLLLATDSVMKPPQEQFRFTAREGYLVVQSGQQIKIARGATKPLILTLPKVSELKRYDVFRVSADAMVVWLFFFAAWSAYYLASQAQAEAANARQRIADAESAARAAQVRALRYQVNPHFLFNTLNSLSALVLANRPNEAEAMILKLSAFFRSSLTLDPTADVSLAAEIALQQHYLDIETVRFPMRLRVEVDVAPGLERALLPALLLQPIVENAIKYGVSATREKVVLTIAAKADPGNRLTLSVANRREGRARAAASKPPARGTGVGLANVCARLNARFGEAATCTYGPLDDGGFAVSMSFPFEPAPGTDDD